MESIIQHFDSPHIGYWHDMGHGQVRENVGLTNHLNWLERLSPHLVGMHVHDVVPPAGDHVMPPKGEIDFKLFRSYTRKNIPLVMEPSPHISKEDVKHGFDLLNKIWA
jgi:sugar phosphate isomerase/epimerase